MNILLTGAGGFIGKNLSDFLSKNYKLYNIYSNSNPISEKDSYFADLKDKESTEILINILSSEKIDAIIHLASKLASPDKIEDLTIFKENFAVTENILSLTKSLKPEVFINFSSMSIYPNISGLFSEDSLPMPQKNMDCIYGLSKYCSEVIIDFLLRNVNIRVAHLRVAQVHGKGMREDRIMSVMLKELKEKNTITLFGNGKRESSFIEINKLTEYIEYFLHHKVSGIFNIGEQNLSYYRLAKKMLDQHGNKESRIVKKPNDSEEKFNLDFSKLEKLVRK